MKRKRNTLKKLRETAVLLNVVHLMGQTPSPYPTGLFGGPPCC